MTQLLTILELASILCLVSLAAVGAFRFAAFPDLSVDGTFTLGAVVFARAVLGGWPVSLAFGVAALSGAIAGALMTSVADRFRINPLLVTVLGLTMLSSFNIRLLGSATRPLYGVVDGLRPTGVTLPLIAAIVVTLVLLLQRTELGTALRSSGEAERLLTTLGRNVSLYRLSLMTASSGLVATSGALLASRYGFADVTIGAGTLTIGVASMILGERLVGRGSPARQVLSAAAGIAVYQSLVACALAVRISPLDVKLLTGLLAFSLVVWQSHTGDDLLASPLSR